MVEHMKLAIWKLPQDIEESPLYDCGNPECGGDCSGAAVVRGERIVWSCPNQAAFESN